MADLAINWHNNTTGVLMPGGTTIGGTGHWVQDGSITQLIWCANPNTYYNPSSVMPGAPINTGEFLFASSTTETGANLADVEMRG